MGQWRFERAFGTLDLGDVETGLLAGKPGTVSETFVFTDGTKTVQMKLRFTEELHPEGDSVEIINSVDLPVIYYVVDSVLISSEGGVTSKDLRAVPLKRLSRMIANLYLKPFNEDLIEARDKNGALQVPDEVRAQWPWGDRGLVLEWVKRIYEAALLLGLPPTKSVGEAFQVSTATGQQLVRRAREAGVLTASSVHDPTKRKRRNTHATKETPCRSTRND